MILFCFNRNLLWRQIYILSINFVLIRWNGWNNRWFLKKRKQILLSTWWLLTHWSCITRRIRWFFLLTWRSWSSWIFRKLRVIWLRIFKICNGIISPWNYFTTLLIFLSILFTNFFLIFALIIPFLHWLSSSLSLFFLLRFLYLWFILTRWF